MVTTMSRERGVLEAPELLLSCYEGGNQDQGSIGL